MIMRALKVEGGKVEEIYADGPKVNMITFFKLYSRPKQRNHFIPLPFHVPRYQRIISDLSYRRYSFPADLIPFRSFFSF
ncbi:hypothetical protein EYC84_001654 [Monilinia fructicola]|uniref:Uncharacterized protein n=1 Tax=Monilinia fructicola TaxID=38448 RepID=A0A5M9JY53_MONFR|nr:hypothetical protein EYC84_001654 [Monilinia fructicola]